MKSAAVNIPQLYSAPSKAELNPCLSTCNKKQSKNKNKPINATTKYKTYAAIRSAGINPLILFFAACLTIS